MRFLIGSQCPTPSLPFQILDPRPRPPLPRLASIPLEEIRALGADEAYRRLLLAGSQPHFIGYYVLMMGLQGRPWNDCQGDEKKALRVKFDSIKASLQGTKEKGRSDLEAALSFFGVVEAAGPQIS